jgi:KDO2-lipid IV(A) lauroyltransferase
MSEAPPLSWLLAEPERRSRAWSYWMRDTWKGVLNTSVHHALRSLPIDACSDFGAMMSGTAPRRYPRADARARAVLSARLPDAAQPGAVDAAMTKLWRCIGRTMAEFAVLDRLWPAGRIAVVGAEHLTAAHGAGKPVLVAGLHLGNWETTIASIFALGYAGNGIYLVPANRFEHRIVVRSRRRYGGALTPARPIAARVARRSLIEKRGPFIIFIDEFYRNRVHAPAFGRPLRPIGNIANVARLAMMTGAVIIPAYCRREGDAARFTITYLPPVELATGGDADIDLMTNIGRIDATIEPIVTAHLDQWFYALEFKFDT